MKFKVSEILEVILLGENTAHQTIITKIAIERIIQASMK